MRVSDYRFSVTREPLKRPFSFKGGSFTEKWITVTSVTGENGARATGIGGLAVLWSDSRVFAEHSEVGGNLLMSAIAEYGVRCVQQSEMQLGASTPIDVQEAILPAVAEYARSITGRRDVRKTLILNSLVSLDIALWKLYAAALGITDFDRMIPAAFAGVFAERHHALAHVPLVTYGMESGDVVDMARRGTRVFKIKLGQSGSQSEMLEKDKQRLSQIHSALGSEIGGSGAAPLYYLDANGRYESMEHLLRLLDHIDRLGALGQVLLLEEPLVPGCEVDVSMLPVTVAGDESVEGPEDVERLADLGYSAFAIKPAGKSLSASLRAAGLANGRGLPCFVADSACVPLLVDWNKNVAARLAALPGLDMGLLESNGADHYRNWQAMLDAHPCSGARWIEPTNGFYALDGDFYDRSACALDGCGRYEALLPE